MSHRHPLIYRSAFARLRERDILVVLLFLALVGGELPFKHNTPGALLIAHLTQPPPDPRDLVPDLPENVAQALQRALAKSPEERYPTAGEFANALT